MSGAQGFNIGMNHGSAGGAGIAPHLHQHVVPRWGGDTNFMPVVARTKVLPQLLRETRDHGATVFLSSHILSEVEHICDRVGIIRDGRLVHIAELDEATAPNLEEIFLSYFSESRTKPKLLPS